MITYQKYTYYKIPITMEPLKYGKLIYQDQNLFIIQVNKTNIALINQFDLFNHVKLFHEGDLAFEYKDHKISYKEFVRTIKDKKFTFINNKLVSIEKNTQISWSEKRWADSLAPTTYSWLEQMEEELKLKLRKFK